MDLGLSFLMLSRCAGMMRMGASDRPCCRKPSETKWCQVKPDEINSLRWREFARVEPGISNCVYGCILSIEGSVSRLSLLKGVCMGRTRCKGWVT